jgi:hypothetical protein
VTEGERGILYGYLQFVSKASGQRVSRALGLGDELPSPLRRFVDPLRDGDSMATGVATKQYVSIATDTPILVISLSVAIEYLPAFAT